MMPTIQGKKKKNIKQGSVISPNCASEVIAFLSSSPSLEQIVQFKISAHAQERLEALLDKNREEQLTSEEQAELDQYLRFRHIVILLKASARRAIAARS